MGSRQKSGATGAGGADDALKQILQRLDGLYNQLKGMAAQLQECATKQDLSGLPQSVNAVEDRVSSLELTNCNDSPLHASDHNSSTENDQDAVDLPSREES